MHFLYIIYSPSADKFYTGETNDVPERLKLHNSFKALKKITGAASDWELKLIYKCGTKEKAVYLKNYLKEKNLHFIKEVVDHPQMLQEIQTKIK